MPVPRFPLLVLSTLALACGEKVVTPSQQTPGGSPLRTEGESIVGDLPTLTLRATAGEAVLTPHLRLPEARELRIDGADFRFQTTSIRRDHDVELGTSTFAEGSVLNIDRGVSLERFELREDEIEHSYLFDARPDGSGDLIIRIATDGERYAGWDETGHHFMDETTGVGLRYGLARWIDGTGASTDVPVYFEGGELAIVVAANLVDASAYPAVLDPTIGAEFRLSTATAVYASAGQEEAPQVAFDGTNYLVVWSDDRDADYDIYGMRVSANNVVLNPGSIRIVSGTSDQRFPDVTFDGTNYVVVFEHNIGTARDIRAIRVSPAGTVVGSQITVCGAAQSQSQVSIASAGGGVSIAAWTDVRSGVENVFAARISGGVVAPANGFALNAGATRQVAPAVDCSTANCLVAYETGAATNTDLAANLIDRAGPGVLGAAIAVTSTPTADHNPAVANDGTEYLVVWQTRVLSATDDIFGQRIDINTGAVMDGGGFRVNTLSGTQSNPDVGFLSGQNRFVALWADTNLSALADIRGTQILPDRTIVQPNAITICKSGATQTLPSIAPTPNGFFAAWQDDRSLRIDAFGTNNTVNGNQVQVLNSSGVPISTAAGTQQSVEISFDNPYYVAVFSDSRNSGGADADIMSVRVHTNGTVLTRVDVTSGVTGNQTSPDIAYNATNDQFFVVWTDNNGTNVRGRLINGGSGAFAQQPILNIATGAASESLPHVAFNNGTYLVVWQDNRNGNFDVFGQRFDTTGAAVGGNVTIFTGANDQTTPDVTSDGARWLVAWRDGANAANIRGAIVDASGTVTTPNLAISTAAGLQMTPRVAYDGTNFVVTWTDHRGATNDVFAARISTAGALLDGPPDTGGIAVANSGLNEVAQNLTVLRDAVAGNSWFISWSQRATSATNYDIYGRRFGTDGGPIGASFAISTNANSEAASTPFARSETNSLTNQALIFYDRFDTTTNYNSHRLFGRLITFP